MVLTWALLLARLPLLLYLKQLIHELVHISPSRWQLTWRPVLLMSP